MRANPVNQKTLGCYVLIHHTDIAANPEKRWALGAIRQCSVSILLSYR